MNNTKPALRPGVIPVRCAIYTRKSTEEGLEQEFNSLDAQREAAEAYIASQAQEGWSALALRYDDGGFTGGNMDRPALQRLMADIRAGKIDCVVVYKVDRLSRSLLDFARLVETFEKHKVAFVSVTQQFNTTNSMGRLVLNVLLSFAQFEREIIGERIRDKIAATKKKGKWSGSSPVLGYDVDRSSGGPKLVVNAKEAAQVREIFKLYLEIGSLLPLVDELKRRNWRNKESHSMGGKPRGGKHFNRCTLYALLKNPIYYGKIRHKTNLYAGVHEAIIDEKMFMKVQNLMRKNAQAGGPMIRNKYGALLRGLIFCKGCNRTMVHTFSCKGKRRYRYYTCTAAIKEGRKACPSPSLPSEEVEKVVIGQIRGMVTDAGLRKQVVRQGNEQMQNEIEMMMVERVQLERELGRHHAEMRKLAMIGSSDVGTSGRIADLHERIAQADARCHEVDQLLDERKKDELTEADVAAAFADFDGTWEALLPREQAAIIGTLVSRIEYEADEGAISVSFYPTAIRSLMKSKLGGAA